MSRADPTIRILIVDDHHVVRHGLKSMFDGVPGIEVVAEAGDGESALPAYAQSSPTVVLLDWQMPRMDGLACARALRERWPEVRIIILSVDDREEDVRRALQAGVAGYLLKSIGRDELLDAIRTVAAGGTCLQEELRARLAASDGLTPLSEREIQLVGCLVEGLANKEIAARMGLAEITVRMQLTKIFAKMQVVDRTQAATKAIRTGLCHL